MLMSQRATSSALTAAPRPGDLAAGGLTAQAARTVAAITAIAATCIRLDVCIFHTPVGAYCPSHDGVVVIDHGGGVSRLPRVTRRLHLSLLVGSATLQHRLLACPFPRQSKAHQTLCALFPRKRCVDPGCTTVCRHFHATDATGAAPGNARNLVKAGARQLHG